MTAADSGLSPEHVEAMRRKAGPLRALVGAEGVHGLIRCPLPSHDDSTPSFSFTERNGVERWRCFGCDRGGDVFDLLAELWGVQLGEVFKRLGGNDYKPRPAERRPQRKPAPPPQPDPERRRAAARLWDDCRAYGRRLERETDHAFAYLARRLGSPELAEPAFNLGLAGMVPPGARWDGWPLRRPWTLALPLFGTPPPDRPVTAEDELPVDLELRATKPADPKTKRLFKAARGCVRTFGRIGAVLCEADAGTLVVIEGGLNWLGGVFAYGPNVLGLAGASTARSVAEAIVAEVRVLRRLGVGGPRELLIDTDADKAGDRAADALTESGKMLGLKVSRVRRNRRETAG